jgi:xylan 1,4-beta-xylosidase
LELQHYRIDDAHSNAYTAWQRMGSPQSLTPEAYQRLEAAGRLELLDSPSWLRAAQGKVVVRFDLPRQALSLVQLSW